MSTSRQDSDYPVEESVKDAVVVMTAFCVPDSIDDRLIDTALENALSGTDHTALVYHLGLMMRTMTRLASQGRREQPAEFARAIAERTMYANEDRP
jgi:hypothetical protein